MASGMETLESSRVCRLCGKHSGISINIFDENENHVRKINAMLPIMVHEMDLLPKHMCHRCSYKLEEFHKFYVDCLKTDATLKSQLSWMRKERSREKIDVPMVHIENVKIKTEPLDYDVYELEPIVENIDYINSMRSVAFPASGIHDGLAYATFSRCRCCCDKKDQSRRRTICQDYDGSVPERCSGIAENARKATLQSTGALRAVRRNAFTHTVFRERPRDRRLLCFDSVEEDARSRMTKAKDTSLDTRSHSHRTPETISESQTPPRSTIVRNLRPRRLLVNYAPNKKRVPGVPDGSTRSKSIVADPKVATVHVTSLIKLEKIDEFENRRSLRPRNTTVDYHGPKSKKVSVMHRRPNKRKIDDVARDLRSEHEGTMVKIAIKQETPDEASLRAATAKSGVLSTDTSVNLPGNANCPSQSQSGSEFQPRRKSPLNVTKNGLAKSKTNRFSTANYSTKCLRSQEVYLRNGKARKYDYMEWSVKRLQPKKLMNVVKRNVKKVPAVLKLTDSIKRYCETCNVSFMNMELFKLHACYYD